MLGRWGGTDAWSWAPGDRNSMEADVLDWCPFVHGLGRWSAQSSTWFLVVAPLPSRAFQRVQVTRSTGYVGGQTSGSILCAPHLAHRIPLVSGSPGVY